MRLTGFFKRTFFTVAWSLFSTLFFAQSPQAVSYQSVVRDASSKPLVNTAVTVIMTINQGSAPGTEVYSETHNTSTNDFGLLNINLGEGTTTDNFADIDWSQAPYYLNININGKDMDPVRLVSVPYSIYADEAGNVFSGDYNDLNNQPSLNISNWNTAYSWGNHATQGYYDSKWHQINNDVFVEPNLQVGIGTDDPGRNMLSIVANREYSEDDPIFQVTNTDGIPVFTIFNDGSVDVQLLDVMEGKGAKGGFAIGGFDPKKGEATTMPFMSVSADSTRFYFNETVRKATKGGFAIGGFDRTKGIFDSYNEYITGNMNEEGMQILRLNAITGINKDPDKRFALDVNGTLYADEVVTPSDFRLKSNISTIIDPLSKVMSLRGVTFNWKDAGDHQNKKSIGLVAQEAVKVVPELVNKGSKYYSINYAPLTALLIEAIKELKKENDELKDELSRMDELEKQIQELRKEIRNTKD